MKLKKKTLSDKMPSIDPTSPRTEGVDVDGNPIYLGGYATDGSFVGYIDEDGLDWECREQRDVFLVSEAYFNAWVKWNKTGGAIGPEPDLDKIMNDMKALPEHKDTILEAFEAMVEIMEALAPPINALRAMNN